MQRVPLTPAGFQKLQEELERLLKVDRPKNIQAIAEARAHGDLSENAEYHAAKDRQGMIHARIKYLEDVLSRGEVIDPSKLSGDTVKFGATVALLNVETDEEVAYQIVGPEESDLEQGRISVSSPLARGLIGRQVGDEVTIKLPSGTRVYEIQEIAYV